MEPRRTLVEKLTLLHTAHELEPEPVVLKAAHHYYDVHQLLGDTVTSGLSCDDVIVNARDVHTYTTIAERQTSPRPGAGYGARRAFASGPHLTALEAE
jgi:hypothetical protein